MRQRFARKANAKSYGQRWQTETVNSMLKRNLGPALRARTAEHRKREMLLRAVTHNLTLARARRAGVETEHPHPGFSARVCPS